LLLWFVELIKSSVREFLEKQKKAINDTFNSRDSKTKQNINEWRHTKITEKNVDTARSPDIVMISISFWLTE